MKYIASLCMALVAYRYRSYRLTVQDILPVNSDWITVAISAGLPLIIWCFVSRAFKSDSYHYGEIAKEKEREELSGEHTIKTALATPDSERAQSFGLALIALIFRTYLIYKWLKYFR